MITKETRENLNNSSVGREIKEYFEEVIASLDTVKDIPDSWTDKQKAIEVTARNRAVKKLTQIINEIYIYTEHTKIDKEIY
jgi:hypothetical protein